jgi:TnpA family transposase
MIKYATAIRAGTASSEAILRRFTRTNAIHPTYQSMIEVGRVQRTIFVAGYLRGRDLQREINEGPNVVESWNRANSVIFFGKGGDIATNRRDDQELSACCVCACCKLLWSTSAPCRDRSASPSARLSRRPRSPC